jgi:hypothetical protein
MLGKAVDMAGGGAYSPGGLLAWGARSDGVLQAASKITMQTPAIGKRKRDMGMILLEALAAGGILILIVWWTMFSGRDKGEPKKPDQPD